MEIEKIKDKEHIEVLSQYNCSVVGKPTIYDSATSDCMKDCTAFNKPSYYASPKY